MFIFEYIVLHEVELYYNKIFIILTEKKENNNVFTPSIKTKCLIRILLFFLAYNQTNCFFNYFKKQTICISFKLNFVCQNYLT